MVLVALMVFLLSGCATGRTALEEWKVSRKTPEGCPFAKAICEDYKRYLERLSGKQKTLLSDWDLEFYEDGNGRHAVMIRNVRKVGWVFNYTYNHILIYNKRNKRTKVMRYRTGTYMCDYDMPAFQFAAANTGSPRRTKLAVQKYWNN
jgi:hypothetical protein